MLSARVAPQMIGLGVLEAIPAADILAREDPDDADGDGISGRAQIVMSAEYGAPMLGRFGLKAGTPTLKEQSAAAFSRDMGLSTWLHPEAFGDCTHDQTACRDAPDGQEKQSLQLIWPYTDLLRHDMGEGLADNRPEGRATGREWRTPPL